MSGLRRRQKPSIESRKAKDSSFNLTVNATLPVPHVLRPWVALQRSLPPLCIGRLNYSFTLFSLLFFLILRQVAIHIHHVNGWPENIRENFVNITSFVGIFHSSAIILPTIVLLWTRRPFRPSGALEQAPDEAWKLTADAILQYCTGYMIQDTYFLLTLTKFFGGKGMETEDIVFLGHHIAIVSVVLQTRYWEAGHPNSLCSLFIGEISNPPMNIMYIARRAMASECCSGPRVTALFHASRIVFSLVYLPMRCVVMPAVLINCIFDFMGPTPIGKGTCSYWLLIGVIIILGSYDFILDCLEILKEEGLLPS